MSQLCTRVLEHLSSPGLCICYVLSTLDLMDTPVSAWPVPHPPLCSLLSSHHGPSSSFINKPSSFLPQDLSTCYLLFSPPEILVLLILTFIDFFWFLRSYLEWQLLREPLPKWPGTQSLSYLMHLKIITMLCNYPTPLLFTCSLSPLPWL